MNTDLIAEIDKSIKGHQNTIDFGAALARLKSNRDFKQVLIDGYLFKEAVRLVHEKASPESQAPEIQKLLMAQIDAIGCLHQYFSRIEAEVEVAHKSLRSDEQTREDILAEER